MAADGSRNRLWKWELQKLADGLSVCHFPPGTSKWNKACFVAWRGRPLTSHEVIVNRPYDDKRRFDASVGTGRKQLPDRATGDGMATLSLRKDNFHGDLSFLAKMNNLFWREPLALAIK